MVKLLRFKSSVNSTTDIFGYGKQPIYIAPNSSIALKNYNIRLKSTPSNSSYGILPTSNIINYGLTGSSRPAVITPGNYNLQQLVNELELACNNIPDQDPGLSTTVLVTPAGTDAGKLNFISTFNVEDQYDLSDRNIFEALEVVGGSLTLGAGQYDATDTTYANGILQSSPLKTSDIFSAIIVSVGDNFEFTLDNQGDSLYGVGYDETNYYWYNNGNRNYLNIFPEVGDAFEMRRSGTQFQFVITKDGGQPNYRFTFQLNSSILPYVAHEQSLYTLSSIGPVSLVSVQFCDISVGGSPIQVDIAPTTQPLATILGFASTASVTSVAGDPTRYSTVNSVLGNVIYSGIMVCMTGLDLESYDFASDAQGKVNFIYTISNDSEWNVAPPTSNRAVGDISNEVYIEMHNESGSNINNKLSVFLLDTASGQKLDFEYCDLLVLIR